MGTTPGPKTRRTQDERTAATRHLIIQATLKLLANEGLIATTTRAIAAEAGISRGALQHHFRSYDDLMVEVVGGEISEQLHFRWDIGELRSKQLTIRVDLVLDHYYGVFSSPVFLAIIPMLVHPTPFFGKRIAKRLVELQKSINGVWLELFSDVGVSDDEIADMRRVAMSAIRGFALRERYGERGAWTKYSAVLRKMIMAHLLLGTQDRVGSDHTDATGLRQCQ